MSHLFGIVADERYLNHETGEHVETPDRLRAIHRMLDETGLRKKLLSIPPRFAIKEEIAINHDPSYMERLSKMGESNLDADTVLSARSFETALLAVGGGLNLVDAVLKGEVESGFALLRPPGHHAERERGMGFCLFNNIAIAARHLINAHRLKRIAIVDWDLHHGNGTEHSFYGEKEVLYLSIHQHPCYPGTGSFHDIGEGEGEGFNINLPISAGVGDDGYIKAFQNLFLPIMRAYEPEIILISAGFDSHLLDPLGGMEVSATGFGEMTRLLAEAADELCNGRSAFFLEGGYSLKGLSESVKAVIKMMIDKRAPKEPLTKGISADPFIDRAIEACKKQWALLEGNP